MAAAVTSASVSAELSVSEMTVAAPPRKPASGSSRLLATNSSARALAEDAAAVRWYACTYWARKVGSNENSKLKSRLGVAALMTAATLMDV